MIPSKKCCHTRKLLQRIMPTGEGHYGNRQYRSPASISHSLCLQNKHDDIAVLNVGTHKSPVRCFSSSSHGAKTLWSTVDNLTDLLLDNIILENGRENFFIWDIT
jgi:hypothetical protein